MDSNQFREAARSSVDEIIDYNDTIVQRPVVSQVSPGYLAKLVPPSPPQSGEPWSAIQSDIETKIQPGLTHWQHPRYMAWFPASVTYPSILGEIFSAAFSSANFNWICSPAVTELETIMMDWVAQLLNLPDCFLSKGTGGGSIQGTASDALVTVMVAARERYLAKMLSHLPNGDDKDDAIAELRGKLVALGSEQAHSCTAKGARIAGVRYRSIPTRFEDDLAMTAASVAKVIDELKTKGLHPFYITSSIGTTGTCAVDEIGAIAEVLRANHSDVWHHIDAAWAGTALCLPSVADKLSPQIALVDSFETNLHKWGLVNLDAACLFVQRRRDLTDAFSMTPSYLRNDMSDSGLVTDYRDWGVPLGRRFRSLKIWFVLRTYGIDGFRALIEKHLGMGDKFAALVRGREDIFEIVTRPAFALTALRCVPPGVERGAGIPRGEKGTGSTDLAETEGLAEAAGTTATAAATNGIPSKMPPVAAHVDDERLQAANTLTRQVYETVNRDGEFFLTSTVVNGVYVIRVVSANPNAEWKYLEQVFDKLVQTTERAIAQGHEGVKKA